MGLHVLTFAQLKNEAEHAISGTPDARTSTSRLVNGALEYLCSRHPWSWRIAITTLDFTANVNAIPLPADFGELIDLMGQAAQFTAIKKAHPSVVARARIWGLQNNLSMVYYMGQAAQTVTTAVPGRTLEVGPAPASTVAQALTMTYRRLIPELAADNDVPAIPYGMFELLRVLVRAFSFSNTQNAYGHDWELFNAMLPDFIAADTFADGPDDARMIDQLVQDSEGLLPVQAMLSISMPGDP